MNPYIETLGAVAAKDQYRAAYMEWRNSFTPLDWEFWQLCRRQQMIAEGAAVRSDGLLVRIATTKDNP